MNNPLIPQLRQDKNGKLVTRHVADKTLLAGPARILPAPSAPSPQETPAKTAKELKDEALDSLMELVFPDSGKETQKVKNARATASWFRMEHFEALTKIINKENRYVSYLGNGLAHKLSTGKGFDAAMEASVFDLANALHDAGFGGVVPTQLSDSYFGDAGTLYIKDSHISDFRMHYLATVLELKNYDSGIGKMEY